MARDAHASTAQLFTQVEVNPGRRSTAQDGDPMQILKDIVAGQDRQNELLEELISVLSQSHRQRASELNQWKQGNPQLAHDCRAAADVLGRVQNEYLQKLTQEIREGGDCLNDSDFLLSEFVDRYGPRLAHLHGVLQILSQLGANNEKHK